MAKTLVLGFKTSTDKTFSISINRPAEGITGAEIKDVMQTIIDEECIGAVITQTNGDKKYQLAKSIATAKFVTTEDTAYDFED